MPEPKSVLDRLYEADQRFPLEVETGHIFAAASADRETLHSLIAVARAAQRYREIGKRDPTSLDLPPAGADLDRAISLLIRDSDA